VTHARDTRTDPRIGDKFRYGPIYIEITGCSGDPELGGRRFLLRVINPGVDESSAYAIAPLAEWIEPAEWTYAQLAAASREVRQRRIVEPGPAPE